MCGCMSNHSMTGHDHDEPQSVAQSQAIPVAVVPASDYKCTHCGYPLQYVFTVVLLARQVLDIDRKRWMRVAAVRYPLVAVE